MLILRNRLRLSFHHHFTLIQKLTILTGTVVVLFMTLFAWVNINNLQKLLINHTIKDLDNLSSIIIKMTRCQMLVDNRPLVYQMMREVASRPGIQRIRLVNSFGTVVYTAGAGSVDKPLSRREIGCNLCHSPENPIARSMLDERIHFYSLPDGHQMMGMVKSISNEPSCSTTACHAHTKEDKILGVVDIVVSLDTLKSDLTSYRNRIILLTILLIILLGASLTFFTLYLVNRPVNELLRHTSRLAQGHLDCELVPTSNDELGELMKAFQLMTSNLRQARNDLEEWGRTLEQKVEERTDQLQRIQKQLVHSEKLASLGELVAGIAHEINNPLSGILIYSELLSNDNRLNPELHKDMEIISSETQRCAGIVKGLLEFARDYNPLMNRLDINQVLQDSLRLVQCQSAFQNVVIRRQFDTELPVIMADQNQLKQVFINIFINAGQAMQDLRQGELFIVTRRAMSGRDGVVVEITDSGCGVPDEQLGRLFDPFFSTKGAGGTGLGLSVSYGIIQAHGGTIAVESTLGIGTTFIIWLPPESTESISRPQDITAPIFFGTTMR